MKYNKSLSLGLLAGLLFTTACSLEENNPSGVSTDQEWRTPSGFEKKINDCYFDLIRIIYGQAEDTYLMVAEAGTDIWQDAVAGGSNGGWSQILRYDGFGATTGMLSEGYAGFYSVLNSCNAAIFYADKVNGLSKDQIDALVAEAHFIRAHALFNIVEHWGGKYLPTEPTTSPLSSLPCSKVNEFYDIIISDLKFAMDKLPVSQSVRGHVTRAAAYHLYAKATMTYATYTDGLGNTDAISAAQSTELLNEAQKAAEYLINNASALGVKFYGDVEDVFDENNNKTNEEALFVVCHSSITAYNPRGNYFNRVWKHTSAYSANTAGIYLDGMVANYATNVNGIDVPKLAKGNCYMQPSKYMLDLYNDKDLRYKAFFKDTYYVNKPTETDGTVYVWTTADAQRYKLSEDRVGNPVFNITLGDTAVYLSRKTVPQAERNACRYAIYNIADNYANPAEPLRFFPSLKKADTPALYAGSNANKPYSSADCIVYRLGETYLLSAEAAWRLGNTNLAVSRINELRNRACLGHDHSMDISAADVTQDFLLDEYAREMIGEWSRWSTLKRFRAFESRLAKANPQITKFNKDIHYLRPIPLAEIQVIENPQEYQNPGY